MDIYDRIKLLCKQRGETVQDAEQNMGFARGHFYKWKKSHPTTENIKKVADYFDVSVDYLASGNNDRFSNQNIELDIELLTNKDLREFIEKWQLLNKDNKRTLKSNMDFMLSEQNKKK